MYKLYICVHLLTLCILNEATQNDLILITHPDEVDQGYLRLHKSSKLNGIHTVLVNWGFTHPETINLLTNALQGISDDTVVLYIDSYDAVMLNSSSQIIQRYNNLTNKIIFARDTFCPTPKMEECPGTVGFIGTCIDIKKMLSEYKSDDPAWMFYRKLYSDKEKREELSLQLDEDSTLFQNLNGKFDSVTVKNVDYVGQLHNVLHDTVPAIVYVDATHRSQFNSLTDFLGNNWTPLHGCQQCKEDIIPLDKLKFTEYPVVTIAIFIEYPTPFMNEFFHHISDLVYPKQQVDVIIYSWVKLHRGEVDKFVTTWNSSYRSMRAVNASVEFVTESGPRNDAIESCLLEQNSDGSPRCDFLLVVSSSVQLTNENTLNSLVAQNRSILAPMVTKIDLLWANFWGALDANGFYARSDHYVPILEKDKIGLWNVPLISEIYLIQAKSLPRLANAYKMQDDTAATMDMYFAGVARQKHVFMYVTNMDTFGHLVHVSNYSTSHLHNDLWEIANNPTDWNNKYLHPRYDWAADEETTVSELDQPCPDVFSVPLVSATFCRELIEEMEAFGQWSDGTNSDSRLDGGYENVPTRDIHMRQVGWEEHWIYFQRTFIYPLQIKMFQGYTDEPWARMNFVVRYRPDEQPALRPHHDASSYSINIALNERGKDFQGGGTRFLRYNCSVTYPGLGWGLLHPGKVTHYHEGLRTTGGTRYIFVTFVSP